MAGSSLLVVVDFNRKGDLKMIINPGSENKGGTLEQATIIAKDWLNNIHKEGYLGVRISKGKEIEKGMFRFTFKHDLTKKEATLDTHGFTDEQCKKFIFSPRVYWNGSSTADPKIEDFLPDGWKYKIEYYQ